MRADTTTSTGAARAVKRKKAGASAIPATIGARLRELRESQNPAMSQGDVAKLVVITHKSGQSTLKRKLGEQRELARTAYIAYEMDRVRPVLEVVEQLAVVLGTTPEYIAWGRGAKFALSEMVYNPKTDEWERGDHVSAGAWALEPNFLHNAYGLTPAHTAIVVLPDDSGKFVGGEAAVVDTNAAPLAAAQPFIYGDDDGVHCALVSATADGYKIKQGASVWNVDAGDINLLGKVCGKISIGL